MTNPSVFIYSSVHLKTQLRSLFLFEAFLCETFSLNQRKLSWQAFEISQKVITKAKGVIGLDFVMIAKSEM